MIVGHTCHDVERRIETGRHIDEEEHRTINNHAAFIWSVADLLRGDYKQSEYGRVILPFTVLRRLDCVLAPTKDEMLAQYDQVKDRVENFDPVLDRLTDIEGLWNTSPFDFRKLLDDPDNLADNLRAYIAGFSPEAREILDKFDFPTQINRLDKANLLYLVVSKFADLDLHPDTVSNLEMGYLYEELIRRFSELSNETAGEHFTPREVIRLMVNLLFAEDDDLLSKPGHREDPVRPGVRHRRHVVGRRGPPARAQRPGPPGGVRPGAERRDLRHLPLRHDAQGPGRLEHRLRQLASPRTATRAQTVRLPARQPAVRGRVEEGRGRRQGRARHQGLRRTVRCRAAADQRRQLPVPAAHDLEDEAPRGRRLAAGDRVQRLPAVHRCRRVGGVGDPPVDHRERLARSRRRPARTSCSTTPASPPTSGSSPTARPPTGGARCS